MQIADIKIHLPAGLLRIISDAGVEGFGVEVHGADPHAVLAIGHDPLHEMVGGLKPRPPEEDLACLGTLVVADGAMSISWFDRRPAEPDWDQAARDALAVV